MLINLTGRNTSLYIHKIVYILKVYTFFFFFLPIVPQLSWENGIHDGSDNNSGGHVSQLTLRPRQEQSDSIITCGCHNSRERLKRVINMANDYKNASHSQIKHF